VTLVKDGLIQHLGPFDGKVVNNTFAIHIHAFVSKWSGIEGTFNNVQLYLIPRAANPRAPTLEELCDCTLPWKPVDSLQTLAMRGGDAGLPLLEDVGTQERVLVCKVVVVTTDGKSLLPPFHPSILPSFPSIHYRVLHCRCRHYTG
jgi:hypothetical protein